VFYGGLDRGLALHKLVLIGARAVYLQLEVLELLYEASAPVLVPCVQGAQEATDAVLGTLHQLSVHLAGVHFRMRCYACWCCWPVSNSDGSTAVGQHIRHGGMAPHRSKEMLCLLVLLAHRTCTLKQNNWHSVLQS